MKRREDALKISSRFYQVARYPNEEVKGLLNQKSVRIDPSPETKALENDA